MIFTAENVAFDADYCVYFSDVGGKGGSFLRALTLAAVTAAKRLDLGAVLLFMQGHTPHLAVYRMAAPRSVRRSGPARPPRTTGGRRLAQGGFIESGGNGLNVHRVWASTWVKRAISCGVGLRRDISKSSFAGLTNLPISYCDYLGII